jgi:sugar/nucleoside kinase (ribokinase family)
MPEVIICGPASWNHIVDLERLPEPVPHMQFARGDHYTLGGTSAGKALHLSSLGRSTRLYTAVGTDGAAALIIDSLSAAGVDVVSERVEGPSERHLNLMGPAGARVSLYLTVPRQGPPNFPPGLRDDLASASAIVLDLSTRSRELADQAAACGVPIWTDLHDFDGSSSFHQPFLSVASYVFMNADKMPSPLSFLHATVQAGAEAAVCTLGARGAVAVDAKHTVHRVAAAHVPRIVDTNGAGDAFMAGFLNATLDAASVRDALAAGTVQATSALTTKHLSPLLDGS